ncbi:hypothetical protein AWM75_07510 [Aerococcus urinaehominis]|uniref:phosphomevalonate kinase n=1 Tax=Aerococcus urinaehominis TaxID=128944 RepID=A0A109RI90_9LACT|nr:phosphomevalonate kinase [Aerococcus urinaehominis]AMB99820.1 hypothetical protein AWM75_07510 [Aerococcus urinaehominis]SDM55227.1 phosphomevalonate kinase [Aerococcus urinaehominis]
MPSQTVTSRVPGKLYLAGEYAVVANHQPALVTAVDAFLAVTAKKSQAELGVLTTNLADHPFMWFADADGHIVSNSPHAESFDLIWQAIEVASRYCLTKAGLEPADRLVFNLDIKSQLDSPDGQKYGLGSSGAVTLAVLDAVLQLYGVDSELSFADRALVLYKLGVISQTKLGLKGSFGDLAASARTGVVYYRSFDRAWFADQAMTTGPEIADLVASYWPLLTIDQLALPANWQLSLVWTQEEASTETQINHANRLNRDAIHKNFLNYSRKQVDSLQAAWQGEDFDQVCHYLAKNRETISFYTKQIGKAYETDRLKLALEIADDFSGQAKISGAGAGDCAYLLCQSAQVDQAVKQAWQQAGLTTLDYNFYQAKED